jgi:hypothetical protein
MGETGRMQAWQTSPAGGTRKRARTRKAPPRFLAFGIRYAQSPLRELPIIADEPDVRDRIAGATSLRDEPECVGPAILDPYGEDARKHQQLRHLKAVQEAQARRPQLDPTIRVADIERRAKDRHADLTKDTRLIRMWLDTARNGGRKPPQKALDRIVRLENQLDGVEAAA